MITRQQAIERLCALTEKIMDEVQGYDWPSDCICGKGGFWNQPDYDEARDYRNAGKTIEFIEAAVEKAIAEEKARRLQ